MALWHCGRALELRSRGHGLDSRLDTGHKNLGQVSHTYVPLSPSSIIQYRCNSWEGNGRLWKRCGLPSVTLGLNNPLPAQDNETEMSGAPDCRRAVRGHC